MYHDTVVVIFHRSEFFNCFVHFVLSARSPPKSYYSRGNGGGWMLGTGQNLFAVCVCVYVLVYSTPVLASICTYCTHDKGTRWRSWLRHRTTSRKVAGLIPDVVIGIFH